MTCEVPPGWFEVTVADVVSRPRAKVLPAQYPDLPFVGMDQIASDGMELLGSVPFGSMKSNGGLFLEGDVLYGRMRPYLNKVHRAKTAGACSAEFIVFPKTEAIDGDLLAYLLHHRKFVNFASGQSSGDRPRVDFDDVSSYEFALPPGPEQQRIVSKIDELFSRIKEGERALTRVQKLVERYRQSVLKAAVTGELTRAWREQQAKAGAPTESGEALLQRILKARRAAWEAAELQKMQAKGQKPKDDVWKQRYQMPPAPNTDGLPELPAGWIWSSLGQLFQVGVGSTPSRKEPNYWDGGIPWVSSGEVAFCRIKKSSETISQLGYDCSSVKLHPVGTVLLAMIGEGKTRGQAAILDIEACHNQNAASIRVSATEIPPEYVYYFLMFRYEIVRAIGQGGNQPALNGELVKSITIPLPPLNEIVRLCEMIVQQLTSLEAVKRDLKSQHHLIDVQRQTILAQAFRGSLVAQDPNDEPASALLERIAAERSITITAKPKRGPKKKTK